MMPVETLDQLNRPLRDLRISVTDRCNFRCTYCMPKKVFSGNYQFLGRDELLCYEEITRVTEVLVGMGVQKVRLTGGEPLVRNDVSRLIRQICEVPDVDDVALTTNGVLLSRFARDLKDAGLHRVTISLDTLDDDIFRAMNDVDAPVRDVLQGIDAATETGLAPIKINAVVQRGVNDHTIVELAQYFHDTGIIVRFIEYMDVGNSNDWRLQHVVPGREVVEAINTVLPIEPVESQYRGQVAQRWRYLDGGGEIGIITSVSQPFCGDCTRLRLSADGHLFTCLFASQGHDLRTVLRDGASDEELRQFIGDIWRKRNDRYSDRRTDSTFVQPKVEMSYIGG